MIIFLLLSQIDSLSLEQVVNLAFSNSPGYYESKISLDKSRILFYQTLSQLLPTISTQTRWTKSEYDNTETSNYISSINLNQSVFDMDIISAVIVANRQLEGSHIQHSSDISNLILATKTAYYCLINAYELLNSSEIAVQRALENQKLINTKYNLGAASRLEMLQAEVFYLRGQQERAKAKTSLITAREELKAILGITNDIYPTDTLTEPAEVEFPPIDSLITILKVVNYNILIAQQLKKLAQLNLIASYLSFLPRVSFFYGYNTTSDSLIFDFQYYRDNYTKNYGLNITFPIFQIKSLIFNYFSNKKDLQLKEFTRRRIILETEKSLYITYSAMREAYDGVQFVKRSLEAATEATTIAKERYTLGAISFLEFLTTEEEFYKTRVAYKSTLCDFYIQRAKISHLLGKLSFTKE